MGVVRVIKLALDLQASGLIRKQTPKKAKDKTQRRKSPQDLGPDRELSERKVYFVLISSFYYYHFIFYHYIHYVTSFVMKDGKC